MRRSSPRMMISCALVENGLKHRAPGGRHQAVAGAVFSICPGTGREMESHDLRPFGRCHVEETVARARRQVRLDVVHHVPIRMAHEQRRNVGHVGLDEDARGARLHGERRVPGVWPGLNGDDPGTTS